MHPENPIVKILRIGNWEVKLSFREVGRQSRLADPKEIMRSVSDKTGIPLKTILSKGRSNRIAHARFAAAYCLHRIANLGQIDIGKLLVREHSSISNEIARAKELITVDPRFASIVRAVEADYMDSVVQDMPRKTEDPGRCCCAPCVCGEEHSKSGVQLVP